MRAEGLLVWLYSRLLTLYPVELRREFGPEMALVFQEQLDDAWRADRLTGAVRVSRRAFAELATVALPARLAPVAAPTLGVISAFVLFVLVMGSIPLHYSKCIGPGH